MKAIEIRDKFGVDGLQPVERSDQAPGFGQAVLKMKAFSVNYRDLLVVNGVGRWKPPLGRVPVSDGVGIVAAVGNGVSRVKVGDRVAPIFYPTWLEGRPAAEKMGTPSAARLRMVFSLNGRSLMKKVWHMCQRTCPTRKLPRCLAQG